MGQHLTGGCACGSVRYETDADPMIMLNCHCRECQRASGSAYAAIMVVPKAAVQLRGEPRFHKVTDDSGNAVERGFCSNCGSPVMLKLERLPDALGLLAGSLDDPSQFKPTMDIFTASAQPWDHMHPDRQKLRQGLSP